MTSAYPLSKRPSNYHFGSDYSPEHEFETTEEILHEDSLGPGILGWMETHEQANIVARQLQRISHIER